jgi:hypothetical protein
VGLESDVMWFRVNVDITDTKEMYSVSVSHSKVLLFLVADSHWEYGV